MPLQIFTEEGNINSLKITLERERELFEAKKSVLSELERKEENRRLSALQVMLSAMYKERSMLPVKTERTELTVHGQVPTAIQKFLLMDRNETVEALNFLLQEFFTNSYPGKKWDDLFISNLVFEVTRTVNLITGLKED